MPMSTRHGFPAMPSAPRLSRISTGFKRSGQRRSPLSTKPPSPPVYTTMGWPLSTTTTHQSYHMANPLPTSEKPTLLPKSPSSHRAQQLHHFKAKLTRCNNTACLYSINPLNQLCGATSAQSQQLLWVVTMQRGKRQGRNRLSTTRAATNERNAGSPAPTNPVQTLQELVLLSHVRGRCC